MTDHRYPASTRDDLIHLIDTAHEEIDAATAAIIKAVEAAASGNESVAIAVIARYVLDNGHVREATNTTLGRLANLADPDPNNPVGFEQALNTWEATWGDHADNHTGMPTTADDATAAKHIRDAIAAGCEQLQILQAARKAGEAFRSDIAYFLTRR